MFSQFKDLLGDVSRELGLDQRAKIQAIAETYGQVVDARILKATRITTLKDGVLEIEVSVAPMLMELSQYERRRILKALQEHHPLIRDLRFRSARRT